MRFLLTHAVAIFAVTGFALVVSRKAYWARTQAASLPAAVGTYFLLFSLPTLLNLDDSIHSPYGMLYGFVNSPVVALFDVDSLESRIFNDRSLHTSNVTFGAVAVMFWTLVSFIVGLCIDAVRRITRPRR